MAIFFLTQALLKKEGSWLNAFKTKIMTIKGRLNLSSGITTAANAHLTDSLLDSWLKNNHITVDIIVFCFGAGIQLLCDVQIQRR